MVASFTLLGLCWAFRLICSTSSPEWFSNISTSLFNLSGDIMLGGLFPINLLSSDLSERREPNNISCERLNERGLGLAIVMKYAVDEINANQILLPGLKLGFKIYDTCRESAVIMKPTVAFLTDKSTNALSVECNYTNYETSISAVIGPLYSEMASIIAKLLGFFLMPQISFGATSDKFSDKLLYPSFFRTVPSDKWQAEAIVLLLNEFKWNWVAVVGSDEEYGQQGVLEFSRLAEIMSVCVAYEGFIPVYIDPAPAVKTIIDNIIATKVGVVVVFSISEQVEVFFKEVIRRNVTAVWVGSTSWTINTRITSLPNIQSAGTIIGFIVKTNTLDLLTPYTQELLAKISEERVKSSHPVPETVTPDNPCPQCWNLSRANISLVTDRAVQRTAYSVYVAIYSVAQALHDMLGCNSTGCIQGSGTKIYPWKLLQVLKNTSLEINGTYFEYDNEGNSNIQGYTVIQWDWRNVSFDYIEVGSFYKKLSINRSLFRWLTPNSEVPRSNCSGECARGQVRRVKGFHSCCFDCIDCLPGTYQANEEDIQCAKCPVGQWSLIRSNNCTEPTFDVLSWETPEALALMLAGVLLLVCQGVVGALFLKHWGTPLVKASGGALSLGAILGLMGACLSLLLFLGQPGDVICRLQLPLTSIFQTVALSVITCIALQILYVSEFPKMAASHLHVRLPGGWLFVLACCAVQAGICGWFVQEGPSLSQYMKNMKINFVKAFLACPVIPVSGAAFMQGFNGAMALVSFMCTFMAAKALHQYNLARDITFSSLIYCVIWVTYIPIYIGLDVKNRSIVHVSFTLASNFGLVAAYYFPKCFLLLRKPELNTAEHFCTFLEGTPPTQAQEEPETEQQTGNHEI